MGEWIALLRLIDRVNYLSLLLLSEWTIFSIAGNQCSKDLDKQYTLRIVFFFCTALFFIWMCLLEMHNIFFNLRWCIRSKCLSKFFITIRFFGRPQGLIQAVFDIGIPILGTRIWVCPNLILSKPETVIKRNSNFLIKSAT